MALIFAEKVFKTPNKGCKLTVRGARVLAVYMGLRPSNYFYILSQFCFTTRSEGTDLQCPTNPNWQERATSLNVFLYAEYFDFLFIPECCCRTEKVDF